MRERCGEFQARRDFIVPQLNSIQAVVRTAARRFLHVYVSCAGWIGKGNIQVGRRRDRASARARGRRAERRRLRHVAVFPRLVRERWQNLEEACKQISIAAQRLALMHLVERFADWAVSFRAQPLAEEVVPARARP